MKIVQNQNKQELDFSEQSGSAIHMCWTNSRSMEKEQHKT